MTRLADPPREPAAVVARGLRLAYGAVPALAGVDMAVPYGSLAYLVGPNGAGKSSLLRVLACLERPDAGSATVCGRDVSSEAGGVRRCVGYVGHQAALAVHLSVVENLQYSSRLRGLEWDPESCRETLEWAGLWHRRHARVGTLSRGMARRLAISLALQHRPKLLLLDEPHDGLDPDAGSELDAMLARRARDGCSVVLATHDLARARASADQVSLLVRGQVAWSACSPELQSSDLADVYDRVTRDASQGARWAVTRRLESPRPGASPGGDPLKPGDPSNAPGPGFLATVGAVLWKDLLVELRSREIVPPVLMLALLLIVVLQSAMPVEPAGRLALAPAALWVSLLLASTLGMSRLLVGDAEGGGLQTLLMSPTDRAALFAGKWLAGYVLCLLSLMLLLPPFVALLGIPLDAVGIASLAAVVALGLVGWTAAGVLLSALTIGLRAREVLLPVVLYPLVLPLIGAAVRASSCVVGGDLEGLVPALALVVAYDVVFWAMGFLLFGRALEG